MKHYVLLAGLLAAAFTTRAQQLLVAKPLLEAPATTTAGPPLRTTVMQPTQLLVELYQGGTWRNVQRTLYSRYTGASLPGRLHTDAWQGSWQSTSENRRRYTSQGAVLSDTLVEFQLVPAGGPYAAINNTYANNQLQKEVLSSLDPSSNTWEESLRATHVYNAAGQRTLIVEEMNFFGTYDSLNRQRLSYNALGLLSRTENQVRDSNGTGWSNKQRSFFGYDMQGRLELVVQQEADANGSYVNSSRVMYQYAGTSTRTPQLLVDEWKGAWTTKERHLMTYTTDDNLLSELVQLWDGSAYQDAVRATFTYRTVTATPGAVLQSDLSVAPNPVAGAGTISYRLSEAAAVHLEVLDGLGRVVQQLVPVQRQAAGLHTVVLESGRLSAGLYLVRLIAGTQQQQIKLLVQ